MPSLFPDHKRLMLACGLLFVIALALNLHGYSISSWRRHLPEVSAPNEILFGKSRWVRADDWMHELPLMLAQGKHDPPFPVVNENIGEGQYMTAPYKMPVRSVVSLFRPSIWGFFLSPDFGLSWMWWTLTLGTLISFFLLFLLISDNNPSLSLLASIALVFSPFFQFWSLHKAEVALHMAGIVMAVAYLLTARTRRGIVASAIFLGWSVGGFALHQIYPPFQVSVGYLLLAVLSGVAPTVLPRARLREHLRWRIGGLALAAGIAILGASAFFFEAKDAIALITSTVYPGRRFSTGGGLPFAWLLANHYFAAAVVKEWTALGNVCESAGALYFFPVLMLCHAWTAWKERRAPDRLALVLFAFIFFLLVFALLGIPAFVARWTLWGKVTSNRIAMGLVLADLCLLVHFLSRREVPVMPRLARLLIPLFWGGFLFVFGVSLSKAVPEFRIYYLLITALVNAGLCYLLLAHKQRWMFLPAITLITFLYTAGFNPVTRGGTALLYENPLSRKMMEIDKASSGNSVWVSFAAEGTGEPTQVRVMGNLPRVLGIKSLDGVHSYPHWALWRELDTQGKYERIYNQTGFFIFKARAKEPTSFASPSPGHVIVNTSPSNPALWKMGVTHVVVYGNDQSAFDSEPRLSKVYGHGDTHIYELKRP